MQMHNVSSVVCCLEDDGLVEVVLDLGRHRACRHRELDQTLRDVVEVITGGRPATADVTLGLKTLPQ